MSFNRVLALSSSKTGRSAYLETAALTIGKFLGTKTLNIAFIPFASVDNRYEEYTSLVRSALNKFPYAIHAVLPENAHSVIEACDAIMVGGGNTFKLLHDLYQLNLLDLYSR